MVLPGFMRRMAALKAVVAQAMTSAARPVTGTAGSDYTRRVCAWTAIQPSMWTPMSLRRGRWVRVGREGRVRVVIVAQEWNKRNVVAMHWYGIA